MRQLGLPELIQLEWRADEVHDSMFQHRVDTAVMRERLAELGHRAEYQGRPRAWATNLTLGASHAISPGNHFRFPQYYRPG